jgi:transaldolase
LSKPDGVYLKWLTTETDTSWWHDSADPAELAIGIEHAATGVTTNPVLSYQALSAHPQNWAHLRQRLTEEMSPSARAEALVQGVVCNTAAMFEPIHQATAGDRGYVCGQVDPTRAGDRQAMVDMARRFHSWAPNISVKLPVTAAGLDAIEASVSEGISVNGTVSFTVAQALAVAERCREGTARARAAGKEPRPTFCTIMIGRQDDYLRDIAQDTEADLSEDDIRQAGLAVVKRAYALYEERGYETALVIAALRDTHHLTGIAGARIIFSIHPRIQAMIPADLSQETRADSPVPSDSVARLQRMPEFVRAYEPDGLKPSEFMAYGPTQRTLTQFSETGWLPLQAFRL